MAISSPNEGLEPICGIITPTGMLGYGFDEQQVAGKVQEFIEAGLPVAVLLDSGSTDSGPEKLALGTMTCPNEAYIRELTKLVNIVIKYKVPVLVSSCGGDGSNEHLNLFVQMVKDIAALLKCPRKLKILAVYSEISKDLIRERLVSGNITGCGDEVPQLTEDDIKLSPTIVGQMGPEPMYKAIAANPDFDILLTGRAYDPAIFVTFCAWKLAAKGAVPTPLEKLDNNLLGGFYHMGKIMECGGVCATPKTPGAVSVMYRDGTFDLSALDPVAKCVPLSVAAHTLYEKSRPDILAGPGGVLDLGKTTYEQLPDGVTVRVRGGEFRYSTSEAKHYTIKLEGARVTGYRYLFLGSFGDPILISQIHEYLDNVRRRAASYHPGQDGNWQMAFHVYGAPDPSVTDEDSMPEQVFVVGEVLAGTQALAKSVASIGRVACCHGHYRGQIATGGNFAFGLGGKTELDVGQCCEFSVYHLMNLVDGEQTGPLISNSEGNIITKDHTQGGLFPWTVIETDASPSGSSRPSEEVKPRVAKANGQAANGHHKPEPAPRPLSEAKTLRDIAKVIRSKNSGPYQMTFDVIFDRPEVYEAVKKSGLLSDKEVTALFKRSAEDVIWSGFFDQALAYKLTLARFRDGKLCGSGGFGENDVHASQQYFPLMKLPLSESLKTTLQTL